MITESGTTPVGQVAGYCRPVRAQRLKAGVSSLCVLAALTLPQVDHHKWCEALAYVDHRSVAGLDDVPSGNHGVNSVPIIGCRSLEAVPQESP